jgi:hypothetical protein
MAMCVYVKRLQMYVIVIFNYYLFRNNINIFIVLCLLFTILGLMDCKMIIILFAQIMPDDILHLKANKASGSLGAPE